MKKLGAKCSTTSLNVFLMYYYRSETQFYQFLLIFVFYLIVFNPLSAGGELTWKTPLHDTYYAVDLETSFLYIKTTSRVASGEKTVVWYYDSSGEKAGGVSIYFRPFTSVIYYSIHSCNSHTELPNQPSELATRIWMIKKRGYRTELWCNGELLLDFTASLETCDKEGKDWETVLKREVTHIKFPLKYDTASEKFSLERVLPPPPGTSEAKYSSY